MATGMAAFEAKILDGRTGHLLAEVSEQQNDGGNLKAVTYDAFKRYANTEAVFRKWSDQMLRMLRSLTGDRPFHEDFGSDMSGLLIQDVQAIQEIHKTWREKELAGKSQELLDLCADDVTWIPPQAAPILGKAQVAEHLRETTPEVSSIMVTDRAIRGGGSVAYLTSHYSKVFRPPGAVLSQTVMGENLWVLRKFPGQGWKVVVVSWNQVPVELA
jgi:ketosteroid isomerase-like protein